MQQISESLSLDRYLTSAKNDENIKVVFKALIGQILQNPNLLRQARLSNQNNINLNDDRLYKGDSFCKKFWTCQWS